jgi:hypothetical protein
MRRTADSVVVGTPTCVGRTDGHDFLKFQAPSSKNQLRFKIQERQRARVACDALASFCSHVALRREIWRAEAAGSDGERPREPLSQRTSRRTIVGQAPRVPLPVPAAGRISIAKNPSFRRRHSTFRVRRSARPAILGLPTAATRLRKAQNIPDLKFHPWSLELTWNLALLCVRIAPWLPTRRRATWLHVPLTRRRAQTFR